MCVDMLPFWVLTCCHRPQSSIMLAYNDDRQHLWRFLMVVLLFQLHNSIRTRHYLHRPMIVSPSDSPWQRLYEQANPSLFLHMTGLTRRCFAMLLSALFDPEEILPHQHRRRRRPRSLRPEGCLGLLFLYWEYHESQAFVHDFWDCSWRLQQSNSCDTSTCCPQVSR